MNSKIESSYRQAEDPLLERSHRKEIDAISQKAIFFVLLGFRALFRVSFHTLPSVLYRLRIIVANNSRPLRIQSSEFRYKTVDPTIGPTEIRRTTLSRKGQ
jgi:hypothetical protein